MEKKNFKILLVDDEESVRQTAQTVLIEYGYNVVTAQDGKDALEVVTSEKPDLIISDINMPNMNGFQFCKAVKDNNITSRIPFILLTGMQDPDGTGAENYTWGADEYMCKPVDWDIMLGIIKNLLSDIT